ncbi:MAG: single-stranded DNA-binding protein [Bacteroidota bacterium]
MAGVNKVILVGHLGKDPEVRTLEAGTKVATFSLATTESFKGKDGQRIDQTEWHSIVLWRGLAEVAEKYLKKGQLVYIEGKLKTRSWEKDGVKKYTTEIQADNMSMLGGKKDGQEYQAQEPAINSSSPMDNPLQPSGPTDDLPF